MRRKIAAIAATLLLALGLASVNPPTASATSTGVWVGHLAWIYNPDGTQFYRVDIDLTGTWANVDPGFEYSVSISDINLMCTAGSGPFDNTKLFDVNGTGLTYGGKNATTYNVLWSAANGGNINQCTGNYQDYNTGNTPVNWPDKKPHLEYHFTVNRAAGPIDVFLDATSFTGAGCGAFQYSGPGHIFVYVNGSTCFSKHAT